MRVRSTGKKARGFTLTELSVAIFFSIVIIGALYIIFSRVQEVFRTGHSQAKVLERGRAVMDMIVRDLEKIDASEMPGVENLIARDYGVEFYDPKILYNLYDIVSGSTRTDRNYYFYQGPSGVLPSEPGKSYWRWVEPGTPFHDSYAPTLPGWNNGKPRMWQNAKGATYNVGDLVRHGDNGRKYFCQKGHVHEDKYTNPQFSYWGRLDPWEYQTHTEPWKQSPDLASKLTPDQFSVNRGGERLYSGDFVFLGRDSGLQAFGYGLYSPHGKRKPNPLTGTLYRYHENNPARLPSKKIEFYKKRAALGNYQKVTDGVVHLRMRAISAQDPGRALMQQPYFTGKHVPLFVEVELGLLEDPVTKEMNARTEGYLPGGAEWYKTQMSILRENMDKVHFFRQLVPIRNSRYFGLGAPGTSNQELSSFRKQGFDLSQGSKHVFIIDRSSSMATDYRLEDVRVALNATLAKLESGKQYSVIFYNHASKALNNVPRLVSGQDVEHASNRELLNNRAKFFAEFPPQGYSNPRDALSQAFALGPDTIWLLTDGPFDNTKFPPPSSGAMTTLPPVYEHIKLLKKKYPSVARVHTYGFARKESDLPPNFDRLRGLNYQDIYSGTLTPGIDRGAPTILKDIAEENGGIYTFIQSDATLDRTLERP